MSGTRRMQTHIQANVVSICIRMPRELYAAIGSLQI